LLSIEKSDVLAMQLSDAPSKREIATGVDPTTREPRAGIAARLTADDNFAFGSSEDAWHCEFEVLRDDFARTVSGSRPCE
jgi:hypothetical protein